MPKRIQRLRKKGWRKPENAVIVMRRTRTDPGRRGNTFLVERFGRETAVELFRVYTVARMQREPEWLAPLRGKDLCCSCKLTDLCHADVLLVLANPPSPG